MNIQENISLQDYTTFKIGGLAKFFCIVQTEEDIRQALEFAQKHQLKILVLGAGSNLLISDQGFNGLVIINQIKGIKILDQEQNLIEAGSGDYWDDLVGFVVEKGFGGAECLSGIPGTVGGAIVQNAGAYGQNTSSLVFEVMAIDLETKILRVLKVSDCNFSYRTSIFKTTGKKLFVVKVIFKFNVNPEVNLNYHDLTNYFKGKTNLTISEIRKAILDIRSQKGYVITNQASDYKNAGSFYKNPVVTQEIFTKIKTIIETEENIEELTLHPYYWDLGNGQYKIAAAKLLQSAGFKKGYISGNVGISPKHSLSLVNLGGAHAVDIWNLDQTIKGAVFKKFQVKLEEEVIFIGEF